MKHWKPIFVEHSRVPVWLSKFTPININAITLFCVVCARGDLSERTKRHETIHFQQFLETFVVGFIVLYYVEYFIRWLMYGFDGRKAYRMISFEQEAHDCDEDVDYLFKRKRYSWLKGLLRK